MRDKATHDAPYDEADEVAGEATDAQNRTLLKVLPVLLLVAVALTGGGLYFAAFQVVPPAQWRNRDG